MLAVELWCAFVRLYLQSVLDDFNTQWPYIEKNVQGLQICQISCFETVFLKFNDRVRTRALLLTCACLYCALKACNYARVWTPQLFTSKCTLSSNLNEMCRVH